ncbi:hypothetical protein MMUR_47790 [Mycolicibacterium murale]|uniref:Uncharacterized protein n=1 Tax=Mycolicibacterium murale TaxID=182220 RepID=A0A7I9WSR1_9MYCO|nr:hypothetical protein [Mycolicibacterium murale]MCV7186403.1 hypothetical protein [Mycolicibacterium murale]GFG60643.1 hypothetical protein MMUR_47790 [Mycolicibacterium murale]
MKIDVADREQAFQRYLEKTVNLFAKIEDDGEVPWFKDPEKIADLGITATDPTEIRRELFMRRYERKGSRRAA